MPLALRQSTPSACEPDASVPSCLLEQFPAHHVERAYQKAHYLKLWLSRCRAESCTPRLAPRRTARQLAAEVVAEAKRVEGADFRISVRSLQLWKEASPSPSGVGRADQGGRVRGQGEGRAPFDPTPCGSPDMPLEVLP